MLVGIMSTVAMDSNYTVYLCLNYGNQNKMTHLYIACVLGVELMSASD